MNYKKVYDQLIVDRLNKQNFEGYGEKHHIVPKSLGGSDEAENIIKLTASDHFFAHILLAHIYPGKMSWALKQMLNFKRSDKKNRNQYEYLKSRLKHSNETKLKIGLSCQGRLLSDETKLKISIKGKSRKLSKLHKFRIKLNQPQARQIVRIDKNNSSKHYSSIAEASRNTQLNRSNITACLNNITNSCGGFNWKYKSCSK